MFFLAEFQEAGVFKDMIRTLLASICDIIYRLIIVFYQLFMAIGDATILTSADIQKIFNRIGLILGIIMMFRLIFSFVQYLLDPDKITDKETGVAGLIRKVIIVILALGLVNWVFEKAFELQSSILEENVIGKVILGVGSSKDIDMKEFGTMFSYTLYSNFYYQNPEMDTGAQEGADTIGCGSDYFDTELKNYVATYNDFEAVHKCINEEGRSNGNLFGHKIYYTTYHGLEALVVGGFVLWVLIMYTITLGVRVIKLAFLRVIAPIPILSYLSPKKSTTFSNWLRQCIMTYLDLFIRIAIIYFAMLLIDIIFSRGAILGATTSFAVDGSDKMLFIGLDKWFNIILVLGILLFAKKMPEIIGDLFPGFGGKGGLDFGIGLKSRTDFVGSKQVGNVIKRTPGALIGAGVSSFQSGMARANINRIQGKSAGGQFLGSLGGVVTGFGRGFYNGGKTGGFFKAGRAAMAKTKEADDKYDELRATGGTVMGGFRSKMQDVFQGRTTAQEYERKISVYDMIGKAEDSVKSIADNTKRVKTAQGWHDTVKANGGIMTEELARNIMEAGGILDTKVRNKITDRWRDEGMTDAQISAMSESQFIMKATQDDLYDETKSRRKEVVELALAGRNVKNQTKYDEVFSDAENKSYASQINITVNDTMATAKAQGIPMIMATDEYDDDGNIVYKEVENIKDLDTLSDVAVKARDEARAIKRAGGPYERTKGEDEYAGVKEKKYINRDN